MRKSILPLLLLLCGCLLSESSMGQLARIIYRDTAMSFEQAVQLHLAQLQADYPSDTGEGGRINAFARWAEFMSSRVCTDAPQGENQLMPASTALANYIRHQWQYCQNSNGYTGNWKNLGPFINSYGGHEQSGRIESLWVDSADQGFILAGSNSGGLWKTTDTGHHWANISDHNSLSVIPGTMGVYNIAVNPLNHNYIYINTGNVGADDYSYGYTTGIAFTANGGAGWQYDTVINNLYMASIVGGERPVKIAYMPGTQRLIAAVDTVLYEKSSPTAGWQMISVPGMTGKHILDFEFSHTAPSVWVLLVEHGGLSTEMKVYNSGSGSWTSLPITLPAGEVQVDSTFELSVPTPYTSVTRINALTLPDSIHKSYFVYCNLLTGDYVLNENQGTVGYFPEHFEVSPSNPAIIYGTIHNASQSLMQSTDSGKSFQDWKAYTHADGRCLVLYRSTNTSNGINDIVLAGTDGGVVQKPAGQNAFHSIVGEGLCISQFYGLSGSEDDEGHLGGGAQDNAIYAYRKGAAPEWVGGLIGGDGYKTKFARRDNPNMYAETNFPNIGLVNFSTGGVGSLNPPIDHNTLEYWNAGANKARPLYFDTANIAHVGVFSIWRQRIGDNGWNQVFSEEPKPNTGTEFYQVLKFILPEKAGYSNVAYVGYKGEGTDGSKHDPTGYLNSLGRLYMTNQLTRNYDVDTPQILSGSTPHWTNITPGAVGWWRMTDFTTDPDNPARLWVALGDIQWNNINTSPDSQINRVLYSANYGATWTDVSKGLPPLPVDKIVFQRGTDDILYAGTDVGVFIWNKADSQWCQFNKNLPPCIVTDMEINYCAGKLRISTFGRGIWESDIMNETAAYNPAVGDFVPNQTEIITANQTWANDRWIQTGIRIKPGITLTIQNTGSTQTVIHMPKNSAIVVEPGAKLIVDGARITNDCGGFWKGILVEGNPSLPQRPNSNQGVAEVKNGAVVEHARVGLGNNGESVEANPLAFSGGIIRADGAFFHNNARSIAFGPYLNKLGRVNLQNESHISRCNFTVDDGYRGQALGYGFLTHIALSDVDGIYIGADSFLNLRTPLATRDSGFAISTWNAAVNEPYGTGSKAIRPSKPGARCGNFRL